MSKLLKVQSTEGAPPTNIKEALELAEKTGVLNVPAAELAMHVIGGDIELEGARNGRK